MEALSRVRIQVFLKFLGQISRISLEHIQVSTLLAKMEQVSTTKSHLARATPMAIL
jgi:hypothetical protein